MNGLTKIKWNLRPAPPERAQHKVDRYQAYQHVSAEKKPVKERTEAQMESRGESFRLQFFAGRVLQVERGSACDRG